MTATERRYAGLNDEILSMDNEEIYGDTFELLTFKEAVEYHPPILSDYKIITMAVNKEEIKELIQKNAYVIPDRGKWDEEVEAGMLASIIALQKSFSKFPIKHAVSFHNTISKAKAYQICQPNAPCMKLVDAVSITKISKGMIQLEDLMPEDC